MDNSTLNCEAYSFFEHVSSDHRIVTTKNTMQTTKTRHYDWFLFNNRDISDEYKITLRNKFDVLPEISKTLTPNDKYKNFMNAHMEAAAECLPTKLRAK